MIKLRDATLLAYTKLRTRKLRTAVTILLASLLFGVLVASSLVINGTLTSVDQFRSDGLTSRHIVNVHKALTSSSAQHITRDPELISAAKKMYIELVEQKTAEAKRLGISYTQASDRPPYSETSDSASPEMLSLSDPNGIVQKLLDEKFGGKPSLDEGQLQTLANNYNATDMFSVRYFTLSRGSSLSVPPSGKEAFYDASDMEALEANYVKPIVQDQLSISPEELTAPFMLPNNAGWKPESTMLPIILPQDAVERLLNLDKLANSATPSEKLDRLKTVQKQAQSLEFSACYRNSASLARIQQTIQQQKELKAGANDKDYVKPALIYSLPDPTKCENAIVADDTRTSAEKKTDGNQELFDRKFGVAVDEESYFVPFKVVGISPAQDETMRPDQQQSSDVNDIINNLLRTSGIGQTIPKVLYDQLSDSAKQSELFTFTPRYIFNDSDNLSRYIEFATARDAKAFIDEQSCTTQYDNTCKPAGRPYQATMMFSNSAALDDVRAKTMQLFDVAIIGVSILAAVIMWIAIGRTIADGRHETAVFRAIGFKRIDIAAVYVLYTFALLLLVVLFAAFMGVIGAFVVNARFADQLTTQAQYSFGSLDLSREFSLIGIDQQQLVLLLIACFATGLLSMTIPLLRNVRRSPIRDMREE